jgi:hypothetical protein
VAGGERRGEERVRGRGFIEVAHHHDTNPKASCLGKLIDEERGEKGCWVGRVVSRAIDANDPDVVTTWST